MRINFQIVSTSKDNQNHADASWRRPRFTSEAGHLAWRQWYQSVQSDSQVSWESHWIETPWGKTHAVTAGPSKAADVVFLHGWSGNGMIWEITGSLHRLLDRFRVHLVDVIGQPNDSDNRTPPVRGKGYGEWLAATAHGLDIERAHWVGMSFGAFLITRLAETERSLIDRVALLGPAGFAPIRRDPRLLWSFLRAWGITNENGVRRFVQDQLLGSKHGFTPSEQARLEELFMLTFSHFRSGAQPPYPLPDAVLARLDAPTLLLCGEEDALFDARAVVQRAQQVLPQLHRAEILPGQGHAIGRTGRVMDRIRTFLEEGGTGDAGGSTPSILAQ